MRLKEQMSEPLSEHEIKEPECFKEYSEECFMGGILPNRNMVLAYKAELIRKYKPASANSVIASLNSFFKFIDRRDLVLKSVKYQRSVFCREDKELSKAEYERLLKAAKKDVRLYMIMQTMIF